MLVNPTIGSKFDAPGKVKFRQSHAIASDSNWILVKGRWAWGDWLDTS